MSHSRPHKIFQRGPLLEGAGLTAALCALPGWLLQQHQSQGMGNGDDAVVVGNTHGVCVLTHGVRAGEDQTRRHSCGCVSVWVGAGHDSYQLTSSALAALSAAGSSTACTNDSVMPATQHGHSTGTGRAQQQERTQYSAVSTCQQTCNALNPNEHLGGAPLRALLLQHRTTETSLLSA